MRKFAEVIVVSFGDERSRSWRNMVVRHVDRVLAERGHQATITELPLTSIVTKLAQLPRRVGQVAAILAKLSAARSRPDSLVYFVIDTKRNAALISRLIWLSRLWRFKTVVHYENVTGLRPDLAHLRSAGSPSLRRVIHVVSAEHVSVRLKASYDAEGHVFVLNGAGLLDPAVERLPQSRLSNLAIAGFLDITGGVDVALDVAVAAAVEGMHFKMLLVGPMGASERYTIWANARDKLGPLLVHLDNDGLDIDDLSDVDVLLHPAQLVAGEQPFDLIAAMHHGIPIITVESEDARALLGGGGGLVHAKVNYALRCIKLLSDWTRDAQEFQERQRSTLNQFRTLKADSGLQIERLWAQIEGGSA